MSPPGLHYYLQNVNAANCSANGKDPVAKAWLMTAPDRTQFWFDCQGYQSAVVDKNGNEADFTYTQRNSNNQPREFLNYITDPAGRETLAVTYYAKGDSTYNYIDANGNVASGTNLTDPDIIDQVKSITDISGLAGTTGRQITFLYNVQGEMAQMADGDVAGSSVTKTFKFGYDATQGNKNVKLVAVTDPRNNTTNLAYTAPASSTPRPAAHPAARPAAPAARQAARPLRGPVRVSMMPARARWAPLRRARGADFWAGFGNNLVSLGDLAECGNPMLIIQCGGDVLNGTLPSQRYQKWITSKGTNTHSDQYNGGQAFGMCVTSMIPAGEAGAGADAADEGGNWLRSLLGACLGGESFTASTQVGA
jgi:hypothetical protein